MDKTNKLIDQLGDPKYIPIRIMFGKNGLIKMYVDNIDITKSIKHFHSQITTLYDANNESHMMVTFKLKNPTDFDADKEIIQIKKVDLVREISGAVLRSIEGKLGNKGVRLKRMIDRKKRKENDIL